jgi:hypothetical protein
VTTHGYTRGGNQRTYRIYQNMKTRCRNPKASNYAFYGGRGIKVCDRWIRFEEFLADMGECPPGMTLDRIDQNGNYELGNCRWSSMREQARNTRGNRLLTYRGETKCVAEWAELKGLNVKLLYQRIDRDKWTVERALEYRD